MFYKILLTLIGIAAIGGIWESGLLMRGFDYVRNSAFTNQIKESVQSSEFLPGPLRGTFDAGNTVLTIQGVIDETNKHRENNGLMPLHRNEKLNKAAEDKLDDMLAQQYFEHNSPDGKTPADVIKGASYEYIVVGENLALGNFKNDLLLVEAWMNSPGHRANILHDKFQEIGVAAKKGTFEGREVWLAVQEFGTPLSQCPLPPSNLQEQISANRIQIDSWQAELAVKKERIESAKKQSRQEYERAVEDYNTLANKINGLINSTRTLVDQYNYQVNAFNKCLDSNV
jgi:hypothetical protein